MNPVVLTKLIKIHASELKIYEEFPFMGELIEVASEESLSPEVYYYQCLGYKAKGGYSEVDVYKIRKLASEYDYTKLMEDYQIPNHTELNKFLGKTKAVPSIIKKGAIPAELVSEVRALSQYLMFDKTSVLMVGDNDIRSIRELIFGYAVEKPKLSKYVASMSDALYSNFKVEESTNGEVMVKSKTIYTPNVELVKSELKKVVELALLSIKVPISYMDEELAYAFAPYHNIFFEDGFSDKYLSVLDYLHYHKVKLSEIIASIGFSHPDFLQVYSKTGSFSFRLADDTFIVSNDHCVNQRLSRQDFEFCLERGYLSSVFVNAGAVSVQTGGEIFRLDLMKGAGK